MKSSSKSGAQTVVVDEPTGERSVNDNNPGFIRGHELSDLDGVPRQPAAETVIHYARRTLIDSFPYHPEHMVRAPAHVPAMDALPEKVHRHTRSGTAHVSAACLGSLFFHAALVVVLITTMVTTPDVAQDEAGDTISVVMLGNSEADQTTSGEQVKQQPEPDTVVSEAVQPDTVQPETAEAQPAEQQPAETPPVETAQPVRATPTEEAQAEPVQPSQAVQEVSPQTVVSNTPEVLTSQEQTQAEDAIVQPMETEVTENVTPSEVQPAEVQPSEVQPSEVAEVSPVPPPETVIVPTEKPARPKAVEKPKDVVKKQPVRKPRAGSGGQNDEDSKKGSSEGTEVAQSDDNSQSNARRSGTGDAAEANYLGKVSTSIARCVRRLSSDYRRDGGSLKVRLTSNAGGSVIAASAARGSGMPEVDAAVLGLVRSCDLPPLPADWGRPTRALLQEVEISR